MAILMRNETPGVTSEQFAALFVPLFDQLKTFPGFIANASGPTPTGYQVLEVWESREAHERWVRDVIIPTAQRAGLDMAQPVIEYMPLDQVITR